MKNHIKLFALFFLSSILLIGCNNLDDVNLLDGHLPTPDLVVTRIESTGPATVNETNFVEVPISVTVLNRGTADAGIFKTSIMFIGPNTFENGFNVAFTVPDQSDRWYPWTRNSLAPGSEVSFRGILTFHSSRRGQTISLYAVVDSCGGDEFMPAYCRVIESNEGNNNSNTISLMLP